MKFTCYLCPEKSETQCRNRVGKNNKYSVLMKRICLLLVVFFAFAKVQSQSYLISFNATGASTSVESVFIENITQGTSLTLDGTDILELQIPLGINQFNESNKGLRISPNPMTSKCNVEFDLPFSSKVTVDVIDLSGKIVLSDKAKLLSGTQTIEISNLKQGFYTISVSFDKNIYTAKVISNNNSEGPASISFSTTYGYQIESTNKLKSLKSTVSMLYHTGDNLRFTGTSGTLTSIVLDAPTANKTITFPFTQPNTLASISTTAISNISHTTATSGGAISSNGGATITASGVCWSTTQNPTTTNSKTTDGTVTGSFTSSITGLIANTTYYVRAYAINSVGTAYGSEVSFTTSQVQTIPILTTTGATNISQTTATSGGTISSNGGATITASGVCWSTTQNPTTTNSKTTDGTTTGSFTSSISGLIANITYYVRAYAINNIGTAYGNEISFKTLDIIQPNTVVDIDGNVYNTVTIGTQTWMTANLKTTNYNDGTTIPNVTDATTWSGLNAGAQCDYNNTPTNTTTYGKLYNWYAVNTGKLCPTGWHVPSNTEWTTLQTYLIANDYNYDGSTTGNYIAKSMASITGWSSTTTTGAIGNTPSTNNKSSFTALPGGGRYSNGAFNYVGNYGLWWSSTENGTSNANYRGLSYDFSYLNGGNSFKVNGFSVRCMRDIIQTSSIPTITTNAVSSITQTTVSSGGTITSNGGETITASGVCWSSSQNPTTSSFKTTDGKTTGSFTSPITGLTANTTYYVRAYATNSVGTAYGNEISFKTLSTTVTLTTSTVSSVSQTTAVGGGSISSNGGAAITASGICWSTNQNPTIANNKTTDGTTSSTFVSSITGLTANTTYYVRAYATNSVGTAYGTELVFTTSMQSTGSNISDIEGTIYNTVTIGTQVWMAENLKTSKYNDGSVIPIITDASVWSNRTTAAVSDYNNTPSNSAIYGKLYNWYAVNTSKICPSGWHVPSQVEWNSMESYLIANGFNYDATTVDNKIGKALTSTSGWSLSTFVGSVGYDQTSNNSSGLNLTPGPSCSYDGTFGPIDYRADYWSSTTVGIDRAWGWSIHYQTSAGTWSDYYKNVGLPIRCLKD